jgi:hypothetical protein
MHPVFRTANRKTSECKSSGVYFFPKAGCGLDLTLQSPPTNVTYVAL